MAGVVAAFVVGTMVGLLARPVLDIYLRWKVARAFEDLPPEGASTPDEVNLRRRP